ncbi:hypothetical protein B0H19DRAFT_1056835 [Mycena capillaripes]|nr:hypothetical protein B0H19DRAFT_1056835 [Mycena capillaripes]
MSSPFASKLGTNYCPQDEELAQINDLLIEPRLRLKRLDDEITTMQKAIDKLSEERDTLTAYLEAHLALASPLRRLPLDIIEEIFMACLPTNRNCVMSALEAPVILGRICSSWRTISLSTPRLWSRLHIVEPTRPYMYNSSYVPKPGAFEAKVAQRLEVANIWLRRSGNCPLSISLESNLDQGRTPPFTPSLSAPNTELFMNVIISFASRWQNIRLILPPVALEALSRLTESDVPLLQHLKLVQRPDSHSHPTTHLSHSSVLHGPSISKFSISGSSVDFRDLPLRWNQLTALSLMGSAWGLSGVHTCQAILEILSKCPKLQTCKMQLQDSPESLSAHIIECPLLRTLILQCTGDPLQTSCHLLSRLSLPDLRDFTLRGQGGSQALPEDSFVSSLLASTHLESISIETPTFSTSSLVNFLRGISPSVRRLRIMAQSDPWGPTHGGFDNDILDALTVSPDRPTLCPALQELLMPQCRKVSDEALLRCILSRMPTLRRVEANFDREKEIDILPSLQPFVETGLQTTITYIPPPQLQFSPWQGLPDPPPAQWSNWGWESHAYWLYLYRQFDLKFCDKRNIKELFVISEFATAQTLPPEIVDCIADGNRGKKKALAASSLVCKAWLQSSRYHLFSEFDVYVGPDVGASFLKLLHHPLCTFVYCIRHISIYPGTPDEFGVAPLGDKSITGLAKLKHVSSLRIHNHRGLILTPTLALLASTFPEVTTLRLTNPFPSFNAAIEFVAMFPMLKSLDFYPWCADASSTTLPDAAPPPNLCSVQLHSPFKYLSWFSEHRDHFTSLTLSDTKTTDSPRVIEILAAFGSNPGALRMKILNNVVQIFTGLDFGPVDFLSNTCLTSLELEIPGAYPSILLRFLEDMHTPNLRALTWNTGNRSQVVFETGVYLKIDARIADRTAFKNLKELHFITNEATPRFRENFPKADAYDPGRISFR